MAITDGSLQSFEELASWSGNCRFGPHEPYARLIRQDEAMFKLGVSDNLIVMERLYG